MMIGLLGIDCATDPKKTGIALGEIANGKVKILHCTTCSKAQPPHVLAYEWVRDYEEVLFALDAPLGWPHAMGKSLASHQAGQKISEKDSNNFFRRQTDKEIKKRFRKTPLDVGANLIARTAFMALSTLENIRTTSGRPIPLAWSVKELAQWRAIEVYPAATRISHGIPDVGGSLDGLCAFLDYDDATLQLAQRSKDAADALVCVLAASDFILGKSIAPEDCTEAMTEGWIWV